MPAHPEIPADLAEIIAAHRAIFGGFVMESDDDGGSGGDDTDGSEPALNEHGFPDKTAVKDMEPAHQAAYWRHQARKHEDRVKGMADYDTIKAERDDLKTRHQTADEKALEDAKRAAADAASAETLARVTPRLVAAEFKSANNGRLSADQMTVVLDGIDHNKFLTPEGEVDAAKVQQYIDGVAPADGKKWPDMGQGRRQSSKTTGVDAGRDLFASRRPKK